MAVAVLSAIAPAVRDVEARGAPPHLRRAEPSEPSPPAER
jgi:hypothetical protein